MDYKELTLKKKKLDSYRPFAPDLVKNLDEWFRVELTYTSNALEGNTLTRSETALVVEKGLTVGGKSLREHLEATNHALALDWVKSFVKDKKRFACEKDILKIHSLILKGIDDQNAGFYRSVPVRISGSTVILPNPKKVPHLMHSFSQLLKSNPKIHPVALASLAHYELVTIHPFIDGNGRTARLLMNLILMQKGYPPALIEKTERLAYINSLEKAQTGGSKEDYEKVIAKAIHRSFDIYLNALSGKETKFVKNPKLLKIGEVASQAGLTVPTIRHWTHAGLLKPVDKTPGGYWLYDEGALKVIGDIQKMQSKKFSLMEIKEKSKA